MSDIWQLIIKSNTLNFIIVLIVICFILFKLNIKKKAEDLCNEIRSYVEVSSSEKELAEKELEKVKKKVELLPEELEAIKNSTKNSVESLEKKIESEIKDKMSDIDNNANRIMNLELRKFKSKLTNALSDASVVLAKENAENQLKNNAELHNKYIDEAIEEIDRIEL